MDALDDIEHPRSCSPESPCPTRRWLPRHEYARQHSRPYLFNHVMRSWLFSVAIAQ